MTLILDKLKIEPFRVQQVIGGQTFDEHESYYLFTGKGLRISHVNFHLGHYYLYKFIADLSKRTGYPVLFQISDNQKRFQSSGSTFTSMSKQVDRFVDQLKLVGFPSDTVFFKNLDFHNHYVLDNVGDLFLNLLTLKKVLAVCGDISVQKASYIGFQMAPLLVFGHMLFKGRKPIVLTVSDQKGYFLLYRDVCRKLLLEPPIVVVLNPLKNITLTGKMSTSEPKKLVSIDNLDLSKAISSDNPQEDYCNYLIKMLNLKIDTPMNHHKTKDLKVRLQAQINDTFSNTEVKLLSFADLMSTAQMEQYVSYLDGQ